MALDPTHFDPEAVRGSVRRNALLYIIQGVLMAVAGVVAIIYPLLTSLAVTLLLGWILIFGGVVQAITLIAGRAHHVWPQIISAVLHLVTGLIVLRNPGVAVTTLALLLVIFFVVEGIAKIIFSLSVRPLPNWGWVLASGVLGLLLGIYLIFNPILSLLMLGFFIGLQLILEGAAIAAIAWKVRTAVPVAA